jgi:hypothetical protein
MEAETMTTGINFQEIAEAAAKGCYERDMHGTEVFPAVFVISNHSCSLGEPLMNEEKQRIRERLAALGVVKELAYAEYPPGGERNSYAYSLVLLGRGEIIEDVVRDEAALSSERAEPMTAEEWEGDDLPF